MEFMHLENYRFLLFGLFLKNFKKEWAEPKNEEQKVWNAEAGMIKSSYGAVGTAVDIEPLPTIRNPGSREETTEIHGTSQISGNPFLSDWGDSQYYQNETNDPGNNSCSS
jgi:hypothetical protein